MALNSMGLGFLITAQNLASSSFRDLQRDFTKMERTTTAGAARVDKAMRQLKGGFILAGAGAAGLAVSLGLAGAAGKFEMGLAGVGAVSRASAKELKMLEQRAIDAGIATQFSPTEAVEGLRNLAVSGFTATEAATALGPALDLAAGGQISVAQASATTASALRAFGLQTDQAAITTDKLLRISNATALQAGDLEMALGNVSRGAGLTKQKIDEMLPAIGLIKNTGVDASVAANAASSALIFMSKSADKFKGIGVSVTDAQGKFRPFMDVVLETEKALGKKFPNEADKAAMATKLFGRFGVTAFQAISSQARTGIRTVTGEIVKGSKAIAYLRDQMATAGGAAAEFREKLLETYEGQKILLTGSLQTAAVVFGKSFAKVFSPVVSLIVKSVNLIIKAWTALPEGLRDLIAGSIVFISVFALVAGVIMIVKAALVLLAPFIAAAVGAIGSMIATALPFILAFAAIVAAIKIFSYAIEHDLGGIGTTFRNMWESVKLVWDALVQLFTQGGFSGAVMKDLNKTENAGLKNFVIGIYGLITPIVAYFKAIGKAFEGVGESFEPVFAGIATIMEMLGQAFTDIFGGPANPGVAAAKFDLMAAAGTIVGKVLRFVVDVIAKHMTVSIAVLAAMIEVAVFAIKIIIKVIGWWIDYLKWLGGIAMEVFTAVAGFLSETFAPVAKWVFKAVAAYIDYLIGVFRVFETIGKAVFEGIGAYISYLIFMFKAFAKGFDYVKSIVISVASVISKHIAKMMDKISPAFGKVSGFIGMLGFGGEAGPGGPGAPATPAAPSAPLPRAAAVAAAQAANVKVSGGASAGEIADAVSKAVGNVQIKSVVEVDGEVLAETTDRARTSMAGRSFSLQPG